MSFADKRLTFAGGIRGSSWGTLAEVVARALARRGYDVRIDRGGALERNPRLVAAGEVEISASNSTALRGAYAGAGSYAGEEPRRNLRILAVVRQPNWEGFAVRADLGVAGIEDVLQRKLPIRVIGGDGHTQRKVWEHYGLSPEMIQGWGGRFYGHPSPTEADPYPMDGLVRRGEFDMIVSPISSGFAPETSHWHLASTLYELRFLSLPEDVIGMVCDAMPGGEIGYIPHHLYRGLEQDTPAVCRPWRIIITRDDMPDEVARLVASTLDQEQHLFQQTHLNQRFDGRAAGLDHGLPLHPGAEAYYREAGYLS
jgi:TRAP-type uncharacterized transport system substrate-binding protein